MCLSGEDGEDVAPPDLFSAGMSSITVTRKHLCPWYSATAIIKSITEAALFFLFFLLRPSCKRFYLQPIDGALALVSDVPPCSFTLSFSHSSFPFKQSKKDTRKKKSNTFFFFLPFFFFHPTRVIYKNYTRV